MSQATGNVICRLPLRSTATDADDITAIDDDE